eukprot:scaffold153745_cov40-Prasinocladus_malaysianus.AAC.1
MSDMNGMPCALPYVRARGGRDSHGCISLRALLTFSKDDFTFPPLVRALLTSINSENGKVRDAAIEAMAVVNKCLDSHLGGLLTSCGADESTRQMLSRRFESPSLAVIGPEGLLELPHQVTGQTLSIPGVS